VNEDDDDDKGSDKAEVEIKKKKLKDMGLLNKQKPTDGFYESSSNDWKEQLALRDLEKESLCLPLTEEKKEYEKVAYYRMVDSTWLLANMKRIMMSAQDLMISVNLLFFYLIVNSSLFPAFCFFFFKLNFLKETSWYQQSFFLQVRDSCNSLFSYSFVLNAYLDLIFKN
ncbi:hypothetical protein RFI_01280, partial [Reticulomyxa filosa]